MKLRSTMILISATACGFAAARLVSLGQPVGYYSTPFSRSSDCVAWFVLTLSLAIVPIRLIDPPSRDSPRRWGPGAVAGAVVWLGLVRACVVNRADLLRAATSGPDASSAFTIIFLSQTDNFAPWIACSWASLVVCGGWNPEPTLSDRLGRASGVLYLAAAVFFFLLRNIPHSAHL